MSVNDTLKFRAYGWKKDYEQKKDKIDKYYREHNQYYPNDAHGVMDEWQALIKFQTDQFKHEERLRKEKEANAKEQYKADLDKQMKEKRFNSDLDNARTRNEYDDASRNAGISYQLSTEAKNLDSGLKNYLHDEYLRAMDDNKRKAMDAKQRDLMEDNNMLERERLNNRDSQRAQKERNGKYKNDLDDVADYHAYLKNQLAKQEKQKADEDYLLG